ncbi:hypothetical protein [Bacillus sp. FJAT-22090]|uniref:hypothetical protein n=1 Tax=Bacillus sp. FJAT-22090 TaxID=1581038 RepID=UPI0011A22D0F|nr:hypothetical protein [Bacillus sp. FJAT-22090]
MNYLDAYKARVSPNGESMQDAVKATTKRQAINNIMNSPTRSFVRLNDNQDLTPVIVSDKETFHKRIFLFIPDTDIKVGDYVHQDDATYLAVDQEKDELYPQLIGELCNDMFKFKIDATRVEIGKNDFGRPIYRDIGATELNIPCVMTNKIPSTVENSSIPLPDGAMIIRIPYIKDQIPKINYSFTHRGSPYKVTNVSYENVINEIGFVEIRLQRTTGVEA